MKRDYPDRPILGVGAVIIDDERALLVRRASEPLKGEWSIPGGALELGEGLRDGVCREVAEETGLKVEAEEVLDVFDSIFTDEQGRTQYHYVLIDYLCRVLGGVAAAASDAAELKWITEAELPLLDLRESVHRVLRKGFASARQHSAVTGNATTAGGNK